MHRFRSTPPQRLGLNRRNFIAGGGLGLLGSLITRAIAAGEAKRSRDAIVPIRSCILVFYYGGPSHLDTWDMKPHAPREVRGPFASIATNVPGIRIGEHLPHLARVVDRLAIIRSLHHPMTNHNAAAFAALSGRNPAKGDLELLANDRNDPPCLGSIVSRELGADPHIPAFVALPHVMYNVVKLPGQIAGFLGSSHDPFQVANDPNLEGFDLDDLRLPSDVSIDRLRGREALRRAAERGAMERGFDGYRRKAIDLVSSPEFRRAFALEREDPRLRDRYGRNTHGQSLLLARRLVEAGVRFISVYDHQTNGQITNWDAHNDVFARLKDALLPPADQGLAALIGDLANRGLLDSTLVLAVGEFGRTPKINPQSGRDHWPYCYSAVMAGGGVEGGRTLGASDKLGAYPDSDGVAPGDIAATLFWRFRLDPTSEILDLENRPYRLADGEPLRMLFRSVDRAQAGGA